MSQTAAESTEEFNSGMKETLWNEVHLSGLVAADSLDIQAAEGLFNLKQATSGR